MAASSTPDVLKAVARIRSLAQRDPAVDELLKCVLRSTGCSLSEFVARYPEMVMELALEVEALAQQTAAETTDLDRTRIEKLRYVP